MTTFVYIFDYCLSLLSFLYVMTATKDSRLAKNRTAYMNGPEQFSLKSVCSTDVASVQFLRMTHRLGHVRTSNRSVHQSIDADACR